MNSSQDSDVDYEQKLIEELDLEDEFSTFLGFCVFALEFLKDVSGKLGDDEDIANVFETMSKYQMYFEKRWGGAGRNLDAVEAGTNVYLWRGLEQSSNFLIRLRNRRNLTGEADKELMLVNRVLHRPLRDRAQSQTQYSYLPLQYHAEAGVCRNQGYAASEQRRRAFTVSN